MKKLRGVTLAMGVAALIGLAAPDAHAGNLTMTITFDATTLSFDFTNATFAQAGSTANNLTVNTSALNSFLDSHNSAFHFTNLGGASNNPGDVSGAVLAEGGTAVTTNAGGFTNMTIDVSQTAFTIPSGSGGTLASASTADFLNSSAGNNQTSSSSFNALDTPPVTYTSTGSTPQSFASGSSLTGLTSGSSYSLDNSTSFNLTSGVLVFGDVAKFTVVPEPASLIMMVTGMPLPLVVMGLLRRRRAAA